MVVRVYVDDGLTIVEQTKRGNVVAGAFDAKIKTNDATHWKCTAAKYDRSKPPIVIIAAETLHTQREHHSFCCYNDLKY